VIEPLSALFLHGVGSSSGTWWRVREDLADLGWETLALDLPGHGDRPVPATGLRTVADLAQDVWERVADQRFDVLVGHSLGAVVALELAAAHPGLAGQVVVVDPPALGGSFSVDDVADGLLRQTAAARADVGALAARLAAANPRWAALDARGVAENNARFDDAVAAWLRRQHWDLPALVADCPVPVGLVVADGPETATVEPARSRVVAGLGPDRVVTIRGGHGLHRDRPGLFLRALLDLTTGRA
jgi:pimeloyl-ACP methyl ester carboxylesterase